MGGGVGAGAGVARDAELGRRKRTESVTAQAALTMLPDRKRSFRTSLTLSQINSRATPTPRHEPDMEV